MQAPLQRTLVFVKPEHVPQANEILSTLDELVRWHGHRVRTVYVPSVPREMVEVHYAVHRERPFFGVLVDSIAGRPITLAVYEGDTNLIQAVREAIGASDPANADLGSLRGFYATDTYEKAKAESRGVQNVIHGSDAPETATIELGAWERYLTAQNPG